MKGRGQEISQLIPVLNRQYTGTEPDQSAKKSDRHPLSEKDPEDLVHFGSQSLHHADVARLLDRRGDQSAHDTESRYHDDEEKDKKHRGPLHANGVQIFLVSVNPSRRLQRRLENSAETLFHRYHSEWVTARLNRDEMHRIAQLIELLSDMERNQHIVGIV